MQLNETVCGSEFTTMIMAKLPWRARHPAIEHLAPFGLACGLLLYALILVADSDVDPIDLPASIPRPSPKPDIERALDAVHASMVELPSEMEAAAIAQLASKTQIVLLENRLLATELGALQADYAELRQGYETELAELQREVLWLRSQQENLEDHMKAAMAAHQPRDTLTSPGSLQIARLEGGDLSAKDRERAGPVVGLPTDADRVGSEASYHPAETDRLVVPLVRPIAWQIAQGLQDTRREAMLSEQEKVFTVDVDNRLFKIDPTSDPVPLDSRINLSLYTARSELIGLRSGSIRFFPDGSSTGGWIHVELYGRRTTVKVDWSTGAVTVEG